MKFIHTSDIHIGSALTSRLEPIRAKERKRELVETFRKTVFEAIGYGASGYIIAGDLFDTESPSERTVKSVLSIIEEARGISFYYLAGNHEKDIIAARRELPKNLNVFGKEWTKFKLGNTVIWGRSTTSADMFSELTLSENEQNIIVLHGELKDRSAEGGVIGRRDIAELPVDYVALGHHHSHSEEKISRRTSIVYSGTPEGRGFDETGEKGYVLLDIDKSVSYKFIKRAKRTLHLIKVSLDGIREEREIYERTEAELRKIPSSDIVRVELCGSCIPEITKDLKTIEARFAKSFYAFDVKDSSGLYIDMDSYKNDRSLKGEFIRLVMSKDGLSREEKERIIECGLKALLGESI